MKDIETAFDEWLDSLPQLCKLWVDDVRPAPDGWVWVKSYDEAIKVLIENDVTDISLDHDLGMRVTGISKDGIVFAREVEAKTGYDVACWIEQRLNDNPEWLPPLITSHSANPVGKRRIEMVARKINGGHNA